MSPPVLTSHYSVHMSPLYDDSETPERLVSSGQQSTSLLGYQELEPGDILGAASLPLLRAP